MHPLAQWPGIKPTFHGGATEFDPPDGNLQPGLLDAVLAYLPKNGTIFYAVWDGYGFNRKAVRRLPVLRLDGRSYLVFTGPRDSLSQWPGMDPDYAPQSPNLMWPQDQSWLVDTDIDRDSTLVSGRREVIAAILEDPRLEALPVHPGDDLSWNGDTVNPRPAWFDDVPWLRDHPGDLEP